MAWSAGVRSERCPWSRSHISVQWLHIYTGEGLVVDLILEGNYCLAILSA